MVIFLVITHHPLAVLITMVCGVTSRSSERVRRISYLKAGVISNSGTFIRQETFQFAFCGLLAFLGHQSTAFLVLLMIRCG